jgi:hypothetical protein
MASNSSVKTLAIADILVAGIDPSKLAIIHLYIHKKLSDDLFLASDATGTIQGRKLQMLQNILGFFITNFHFQSRKTRVNWEYIFKVAFSTCVLSRYRFPMLQMRPNPLKKKDTTGM